MKVAHITDLHVQTTPSLWDIPGKRIIGSTNLYLLGRKSHFSRQVQHAVVETLLAEQPDVVVFTGDLTAQALDAEFAAARTLLNPLLQRIPTVMLAGNHDTYVREASPGARMRQWFGQWMGDTSPSLKIFDEIAFLSVETCRAHLMSRGYTPPGQLQRAKALIEEAEDRFLFLCLHYPLRGRKGQPYGPQTRALSNAADVESFLSKTDRIGAILHGHEHHGYRTEVPTGGGPRPNFNPGASGYGYLPALDRTAHLNLYEVERGGIRSVRRLRYEGDAFRDEPGGAYATGR